MHNLPTETIEILPPNLLDHHRPLVNDLKDIAHSLGLEFGWHYLLDIAWIIDKLGAIQGKHIMDAGAGTGVMQWYLASQGAQVISADRIDRTNLPLRYRSRFSVRGLRDEDLNPAHKAYLNNFRGGTRLRAKLSMQTRDLISIYNPRPAPGQVIIYNQDLQNLTEIPDNSLDAIVAVSSLEHNPPQNLASVIAELLRVLKPGGRLLATLGASHDQDWFHEPSSGWCYTDASLRRIFDLSQDTPSNYHRYDELFSELRDCAELRDNLAQFYSKSGDNGMPWGVWDPQYQPVGVCKIKEVLS